MTNSNTRTNPSRSLIGILSAAILLILSVTSGFGQKESKRSTSRDGLQDAGYMTSAEVADDLDGTDDEYFYKFQAGPGKLTVILEVDANETNAGATLDLFAAETKPILQNLLVQAIDGGTERGSQTVKLGKKQEIVLRIRGMKYGSSGQYTGTYKIRLEGSAVNFAEPGPPAGAAPGKNPDEALPAPKAEGQNPSVVEGDPAVNEKKSAPTPEIEADQGKKGGSVDRAIVKAKKKGQKLRGVLDRIKSEIPD